MEQEVQQIEKPDPNKSVAGVRKSVAFWIIFLFGVFGIIGGANEGAYWRGLLGAMALCFVFMGIFVAIAKRKEGGIKSVFASRAFGSFILFFPILTFVLYIFGPSENSTVEGRMKNREELVNDRVKFGFSEMVREKLNDPSSFQLVDYASTYFEKDSSYIILMDYRGKNVFNATVTNRAMGIYNVKTDMITLTTLNLGK